MHLHMCYSHRIYSAHGHMGKKSENLLRNSRKFINCRDKGVSREMNTVFLKSKVYGAYDRTKNSHSFFKNINY